MLGEIKRQERSYRRGLVMGLTMAEIMVLVVFCLLLLLAWSWDRSGTSREDLDKALQVLGKASGRVVVAPIPEDFLELVQAGRAVLDKQKQSALAPISVTESENAIALGLETQLAFGQNTMGQPPREAAVEFVKEAGKAYRESNLRDPVGSARIWFQSLQKCATNCGGEGGDLPPCARTSDGKAALIFTATLRSDSIELHDNRIAELESARTSWPTQSIVFDQPVAEQAFLEQTLPMFTWSEERACRFFVLISDQTGVSEKMAYKNRLRTVEQHFYKHEPPQPR